MKTTTQLLTTVVNMPVSARVVSIAPTGGRLHATGLEPTGLGGLPSWTTSTRPFGFEGIALDPVRYATARNTPGVPPPAS